MKRTRFIRSAAGLLVCLTCAALLSGCASTRPEQKEQEKTGTGPPVKTAQPDTAAFQEKAVFTYPAIVVNRKINLRSGPGTNYAIVQTLLGGQVITVVSESGEWVKVLVDRDNRMGWLHRSLIRRKK